MLLSRSSATLHRLLSHHSRSLSAYSTQRKERDDSVLQSNKLFDEEYRRQQSLIARIEKIQVTVQDVRPGKKDAKPGKKDVKSETEDVKPEAEDVKPEAEYMKSETEDVKSEAEDVVLLMNRERSTPFDCAQHISELCATRSVLATATFGDCDSLWDMHRPLPHDCTLRFHHFTQPDPRIVNQVFWRSCSFLLGMVVKTALKEESGVLLHSWPPPDVRSGSFVYDVSLPGVKEWNPSQNEMLTLTSVLWKMKEKKIVFDRLSVARDLAKEILSANYFKTKQIDSMPSTTKTVTLYRLGDHIDISTGPMISNLGHIGRASVTAVHRIDSDDGPLFRFQGVAIPEQLRMNHFAYKILLDRSRKPNRTRFSR